LSQKYRTTTAKPISVPYRRAMVRAVMRRA
jgi:hypothetical protein